jgi:PAS domain S-box-containing protein
MNLTSTQADGFAPLSALPGGGEMGERIRAFDWSATPLGPASAWPQSLRTAVRIILGSRYPMFIWWGRELVNIYNDGYRPMLGKRHPAALGKSAEVVWSEIWDAIGPQADAVLYEGRATWNEERLLVLERNGYAEEAYFTFSYSPLPGDDGGVGGVFCALTEDTQRVLGQRRVRTLRDLSGRTTGARTVEHACRAATDALAQNPHDLPFALIYLLDGEGRVARLAGSAGLPDGSPASPPTLPLTPSDGRTLPWPLDRVAVTGRPELVEDLEKRCGLLHCGVWPEPPQSAIVLPVMQSGQDRLAGFLVAGVSPRREFDDDYRGFMEMLAGHVATAVANARAYEEEKSRAEALAELDRAKTAFFSNVSHEFRTPLTLMLGPVEDVLADAAELPTPRQQERLQVAHRNALRLQKLVNALLDFSRIEAGRVQASYQPTDLAGFTADLASNFRSACEKAGLRLVVDCPPLGEPVFVDRTMWEKVVLNLLSNAFKFTFEGEIAVALRRSEGGAELRVRDTGTGIPADAMPRLFERFHRVEKARGRTHEGSGIGLALVQELVRLHGGTITAESAEGVGTTFAVTVPLGTAHLPTDQLDNGGPATPAGTGAGPYVEEALRWLPSEERDEGRRREEEGSNSGPSVHPSSFILPPSDDGRPYVLVADDNADMRQYVARLLAHIYQVAAVPDGEGALAAARDRPPDLILSDVMMPRLDGFGLLRALRADPRTVGVPVILLSARAGEESRVEGMQAGADDYLVKPFSARELLARVSAHLQMARLRREANESLRASEQRFHSFMSNSPTTAYIKDAEGRYVFVNRIVEQQFNRPLAEWVGRTDFDLLPPDEARLIRQNDLAVLASKATARFEEVTTGPDGPHHYLSFKFPLQDRDGGWLLAGMSLDVTEQKRAERELSEAHQFLQSSLDALSSHVAVLDENGAILAVNDAWRRFADENRFGGHDYGVGADYLRACEPHAGECIEPEMAAGLRAVLAGRLAYFEFEYPCHSPTQRRWFVMRATRFKPPGPVRVVVAHEDVTKRKLAEAALRESEEKYRFLVNTVPALVWSCRPDGTTDFHNDRWFDYTGLSPNAQTEEDLRRVCHPDDLPGAMEEWARSVRTGEPYRAEYRLRRAGDGEYRWWLAEAMPMRDRDGRIVRWFGTCTDIHDRRAAEDALKEADRRKDEFLATLAHELRNPLAPVRNAVQVLRLKGPDDPQLRWVRDVIDRQVEHLTRLIDDLLDVSRITRNKLELRMRRVGLAEVITGAVESSRPAVEQCGHELTIALPPQPIYLNADLVRLAQVFQNLLTNAAKYTERGGRIWLTAEREGSDVVVRVRDTGVGIPPEKLPRLFEMFFQVDRTLERSQGGLGIGLSLVRRLVELHGGTVEARSEGVGRGSEFTVRLPILVEQPSPRPPREPAGDGGTMVPARRILIVDDNRDSADSLAMLLELTGHEVHTAYDGAEGVETAERVRPEVVLLDIGMPKLNGYDACRRIRDQACGKDTLLIAMTGWGQDEDRRRTEEAGFDAHLVKPVDPEALMKLLAELRVAAG